MNKDVIITCAVTGNHTTRQQHPDLPVTPTEIAQACLEAADAGAAIVHIHVRDPATGAPSMSIDLYTEVVGRIRDRNRSLVINLTTGPGGRYHPSDHDPAVPGPRTNLLGPERRVEHIRLIKPDLATLDLNTMLSGREVVINTPANIGRMAQIMHDAGVRPELELFDSGDIALARDLVQSGVLATAPLCSIVMGVKYGFQPSCETLLYARGQLPDNAVWTGFATGRWAFPMVAQSILAGGHVRTGLEDAVYIAKNELAPSNAAMIAKAKRIAEDLGSHVLNSPEARDLLLLPSR